MYYWRGPVPGRRLCWARIGTSALLLGVLCLLIAVLAAPLVDAI